MPRSRRASTSTSSAAGRVAAVAPRSWSRGANGRGSDPAALDAATVGRRRIAAGYALACQTVITGDAEIAIPPQESNRAS